MSRMGWTDWFRGNGIESPWKNEDDFLWSCILMMYVEGGIAMKVYVVGREQNPNIKRSFHGSTHFSLGRMLHVEAAKKRSTHLTWNSSSEHQSSTDHEETKHALSFNLCSIRLPIGRISPSGISWASKDRLFFLQFAWRCQSAHCSISRISKQWSPPTNQYWIDWS